MPHTTTQAETKVCLTCARTGTLRWMPCANHSLPVASENCKHDFTSYVFTHNDDNDHIICHNCGHEEKVN